MGTALIVVAIAAGQDYVSETQQRTRAPQRCLGGVHPARLVRVAAANVPGCAQNKELQFQKLNALKDIIEVKVKRDGKQVRVRGWGGSPLRWGSKNMQRARFDTQPSHLRHLMPRHGRRGGPLSGLARTRCTNPLRRRQRSKRERWAEAGRGRRQQNAEQGRAKEGRQ